MGPIHQRFSRFKPSENSGSDLPPFPLKRYLCTHSSTLPSSAHFFAERESSSNRLISSSIFVWFDVIDYLSKSSGNRLTASVSIRDAPAEQIRLHAVLGGRLIAPALLACSTALFALVR